MAANTTKKRITAARKWLWARRSTQAVFFILFILLAGITIQGISGRMPYTLFFHLDPLTGIASIIASRSWIMPMALGLFTIALTLVLGRVWCGWICPVGTALDWMPSRRPAKNPAVSPFWRQGKYLVLFIILAGAALSSLIFMFLDPVTLFFRALAGVILPGLSQVTEAILHWLYGFTFLQPAVDRVDYLLRGWFLNQPSFYLPNLVILAVFAIILGLNRIRARFWCRYLCPLGGLLALIAKISIIRHRTDTAKCISCGCARLCPTGAIDSENSYTAAHDECTVCLKCQAGCPTRAISFRTRPGPATTNGQERRRFLSALGTAVAAAVFFRLLPATARTTPQRIRPPGSTADRLYSQCIRCGECVRVCPTGVIQPDAAFSPSGLWVPALNTRHGYCDFSCNSCGVICPTGAIKKLPLEEKRQAVIGIARIDKGRCITWAEKRDCIVCEEMCPVPEKAIRLGEEGEGQGKGKGSGRHPRVIEDLCTGCGICEYQCPVAGESAIRVFPTENS